MFIASLVCNWESYKNFVWEGRKISVSDIMHIITCKLIHHTACYRPRFDGTSSEVGDNVDQTVDDEGGEVEGGGVVKRFKFGTQYSLN